MKMHAPDCPACDGPMRDKPAQNSYSRHAPIYICSACGVKEALEGFFWKAQWDKDHDTFNREQRPWTVALLD